MAEILAVTTEAVRLWARGQRTPSAEMVERIRAFSGDSVTANDFHVARIAWLTEAGLFHPHTLSARVNPVTEIVTSKTSPQPEVADA